MKSTFLSFILLTASICAAFAEAKAASPKTPAGTAGDTAKPKKLSHLDEKVKACKKTDGLFTLYQDTATGCLQLFVKKAQLGEEYIYQSFSISGPTSMYLNQSMHRTNFVFRVQKVFDRLEFSRINTAFYYDPGNPISKTKDVDKPEAVFLTEKIGTEDSLGFLINADALFLSEKLDPVKPATQQSFFSLPQFALGGLNLSKSKYFGVRSFPENTDVVVDLAYDNPAASVSGGTDITDPRYVRVRMQHSLIRMPHTAFKPRRDDPRIGYFGQQVTDQTSISPTPYKDLIHRWSLVKKNPADSVSEPVEPIVFWIENTTPYEYRQTILEAGKKWNAAFESAGFKNAVQLKIMPDTATWDPSDIRYNVIRWVSSANPSYGAIGPSFVNPKTGQILGADITIEWYSGSATPIFDELTSRKPAPASGLTGTDANEYATCTIAAELKSGLLTGMTTLETMGADKIELGEMHKQFLTYLIMHEMGHTFGLNHNMEGSQMWSPKEINNKELTRKWGLTGSVMDYPAINIALDRKAQGDYYTTLAGPYDVWAIQYGYTPFSPNEEHEGLKKIASRSTDPKLAFGNDGDDMRVPGKAMDPRVNVNDLTSDAIGYAEDRFELVNNLVGNLLKKYTKEGQSFAELRSRYAVLQNQRLTAVSTISRYVGGVYIDRSFPEQKSTAKPFTPVPLATQKRAMAVLIKHVFAPDAFAPDAAVFPYLQPQRRLFNQSLSGDDYKIAATVLHMQFSGALAHLLHPATLQRLTNSRLYGNQYSVADVFADLNKGIFAADLKTNVNVFRQYLQTAYTESLLSIVDERSQYDDVAKAAALHAVLKIKELLATAIATNEETKAHRNHTVYLIDKALKKA